MMRLVEEGQTKVVVVMSTTEIDEYCWYMLCFALLKAQCLLSVYLVSVF